MNKFTALLGFVVLSLLLGCGQKESASTAPSAAAPAAPVVENTVGKSIFGKTCALCHASGVAGAPKPGDKADWAPRIAQGMDVLNKHALEGFTGAKGQMPARGGATTLTDDEVKAAVAFMADQSRQRRRLVLGFPLLACGLVVPKVHARAGVHQASRVLMGTRVDLTLQGPDSGVLGAAAASAFAEMTRLADMMSRYRGDSALNAINLAAGLQPVSVPPELMQVLLMARRASQASGGAFDITVGSLRAWDFGAQRPAVPSSHQVSEQLRWVNPQGLVLDERAGTCYLTQRGMRLDLGGIAKLPILRAGMRQLQSRGVTSAMINGGGDVLVNGQLDGRDWRIGLRDPRQPDRLVGVVALNQGFVAASGDYERFVMHEGRRLHHILDPKTGWPTQGPHGVALISDRLDAINGLGAAIMVAGAESGRARVARTPGLDALIVDADNSLWLSPGMTARLQRA